MGFEDQKVKPTFKEPDTKMGQNFEKKFSQNMRKEHIPNDYLKEVDSQLNEKEESLKKKIFQLDKMEALVHGDSQLSAVYNEMAEDGGEKYGYHYNETIMNLIFNEYVMNNAKFLQKYKMAVPKEKKRRDKSGINQLQRAGQVDQKRQEVKKKLEQPHFKAEGEIHNNSLAGVMEEETSGNFGINSGMGFDINRDGTSRTETTYNTMKEPIKEADNNEFLEITTPIGSPDDKLFVGVVNQGIDSHLEGFTQSKFDVKDTSIGKRRIFNFHRTEIPILIRRLEDEGSEEAMSWAEDIRNESGDNMDEAVGMSASRDEMIDVILNNTTYEHQYLVDYSDEQIKELYDSLTSQQLGVEETTGAASSGAFSPALGAVNRKFVSEDMDGNLDAAKQQAQKISAEEGVVQHVNMISNNNYSVDDWYDADNTVASYENGRSMNEGKKDEEVIDETTTSSSSGQFTGPFGGKRHKKLNQPAWKGGKIIGESNYITDPSGFKKFIKEMDETKLREPELRKPGLKEFDNIPHNPTMTEDSGFTPDKLKGVDTQMLGNIFVDLMKVMQNNPAASKLMGTKNDVAMIKNTIENRPDRQNLSPEAQQVLQGSGNWFSRMFGMGEAAETPQDQQTLQALQGELAQDGVQLNVNEKAESKSQQRFMGMVHAAQKGEMPDATGAVAKAAKEMKSDDVEDFASTKHKGLPEKVPTDEMNEEQPRQISFKELYQQQKQEGKDATEAADFVIDIMTNGTWVGFDEEKIQDYRNKIIDAWDNPNEGVGESIIDQPPLEDRDGTTMKMKSSGMGMGGSPTISSVDGGMDLGESVEIEEDVATRTQCKRDEEQVSGVPINQKGGCKKKISQQDVVDKEKNPHNLAARKKRMAKYEKEHEAKKGEYSKELEKNRKNMDKLKGKVSEDKKPSSLVMKDRLGKENQANFKADVNHSTIKDVIDMQDELMAKDQVEEVPTNPYELAQKIEKEHLATNDGLAFKNVGDSTNDKGDEIPKRNLTNPEQEEVDLIRKTQADWNFDNKPGERFEKRMQKDMGDDIYNLRKKKMEYQADAPMYNKDTMPIEDGIEKDQFDKYKSGWNKRDGIEESMITGKYTDEFGNTKFVNFKLVETKEAAKPCENCIMINLDGLGNSYTTRVHENVEMRNIMDSFKFYMNGDKQVTRVKTGKQTLTEGIQVQKEVINEEILNMRKLMGYDPAKHVSTGNVKKNRNF